MDNSRSIFIFCTYLFIFSTNSYATQTLTSGKVYTFIPDNTQCFSQTSGKQGLIPIVNSSCDNTKGEADISIASNGSLLALDMRAYSRFQKWIKIEPVADVTEQSLIPVEIQLPYIEWNLRLFNDVILQFFGSSSANILFTIREDPTAENPGLDNISARGKIVAQTNILSAHHGGVGAGCLVSSVAAIAAGKPGPIVKCIASVSMQLDQSASTSISAMLRAGKTYNIEIELQGFATKKLNAPQNLNFVSVKTKVLKPAMKWNKMVINIATDPQLVTAGLQQKIDDLYELVVGHTHEYMTGRGEGHNNVIAESSPLLVPDISGASDSGTSITATKTTDQLEDSSAYEESTGEGSGSISLFSALFIYFVLWTIRRIKVQKE